MIQRPHAAAQSVETDLGPLQLIGNSHHVPGVTRLAGCVQRLGKGLNHQMHAQVHIVVFRFWETFAKGLVEGLAAGCLHIGHPVRHRNHLADAGLSDGCWRAQRVSVEGGKLAVKPHVLGSLDQQGQVIAEVPGNHGLRATGLDLCCVRQKVLDPSKRVQLFPGNRYIRSLLA